MSLPLFFALYCLEAGMFFTALPWTRLWTLNAVLHHNALIALWADNPYVRGFVSGLGVVHVMVGVRELVRLSRARRGSGAR